MILSAPPARRKKTQRRNLLLLCLLAALTAWIGWRPQPINWQLPERLRGQTPASAATESPPTLKPANTQAVRGLQLTIVNDKGTLVLAGTLPDRAARQQLVDAARALVGFQNVYDEIQFDAALPTPDWLARIADPLAWVLARDGNGLRLRDQQLVLIGRADSETDKTARARDAQAFFGGSVKVDNQLIVAAPAAADNAPAEANVEEWQETFLTAAPPARLEIATADGKLSAAEQIALTEITAYLQQHSRARVRLRGGAAAVESASAALRQSGINSERIELESAVAGSAASAQISVLP